MRDEERSCQNTSQKKREDGGSRKEVGEDETRRQGEEIKRAKGDEK